MCHDHDWPVIECAACWSVARGRVIERITEGRGYYRQDVILLSGPWSPSLRIVDTFAGRWAAYEIPEREVDTIIDAIAELHARRSLHNLACIFSPDWLVCA